MEWQLTQNLKTATTKFASGATRTRSAVNALICDDGEVAKSHRRPGVLLKKLGVPKQGRFFHFGCSALVPHLSWRRFPSRLLRNSNQ